MKTSTDALATDRALDEDSKQTKEDEILVEAKERFRRATDFEDYNRNLAEEDIQFRHGDQWDQQIKDKRREERRPCLTFNKLEGRIDQVVGDQLQGNLAIRILPADPFTGEKQKGANVAGKNDYATADIMSGLIRAIEQNSFADQAYKKGFNHAVGHGFGYWRILTEWDPLDPFNQIIRIRRVRNSFSVYLDDGCNEPTGSDANWGFVTSMVDRKMFERKYPEANSREWMSAAQGDDYDYWYSADKLRIAEYFRRVPVDKIAVQLSDLTVVWVDSIDEIGRIEEIDSYKRRGIKVQDSKEVKVPKTEWYKVTAGNILEEPREFPSQYIPIIRILGKELNFEGYDYYRGIIRHAKDAQRMYNYNRTSQVEYTALQPRVPFIMTAEQIGAHEALWKRANTDSLPYLLYEFQEGQPMPQRQMPPTPATASMMNAQADDADIDATTGQYKASIGAPSNEKSGKAIRERRAGSDTATFEYHDNLMQSLRHTGTILVDMIPRVYNNRRVVRILGKDDGDDYVRLNDEIEGDDGTKKKINDLSLGRYDVKVTVGPSYTTQREEAREGMLDLAGKMPEVGQLIAHRIVQNMDWPQADDIAEDLKKKLRPDLSDDDEGAQEITTEMVQQAVAEAVQATQEEINNQIATMSAEAEVMAKQSKSQTDEFKALTDRMEALSKNAPDEERIKDLVAEALAEVMTAKTI